MKFKTPEERQALCQAYIEHVESGLSDECFPECDPQTLRRYIADFPVDFDTDAMEVACRRRQLFWEKAGRDGTMGKITGFNASSWRFNMGNRFGWHEKREDTLKVPTDPIQDLTNKLFDRATKDRQTVGMADDQTTIGEEKAALESIEKTAEDAIAAIDAQADTSAGASQADSSATADASTGSSSDVSAVDGAGVSDSSLSVSDQSGGGDAQQSAGATEGSVHQDSAAGGQDGGADAAAAVSDSVPSSADGQTADGSDCQSQGGAGEDGRGSDQEVTKTSQGQVAA